MVKAMATLVVAGAFLVLLWSIAPEVVLAMATFVIDVINGIISALQSS